MKRKSTINIFYLKCLFVCLILRIYIPRTNIRHTWKQHKSCCKIYHALFIPCSPHTHTQRSHFNGNASYRIKRTWNVNVEDDEARSEKNCSNTVQRWLFLFPNPSSNKILPRKKTSLCLFLNEIECMFNVFYIWWSSSSSSSLYCQQWAILFMKWEKICAVFGCATLQQLLDDDDDGTNLN